MWSEILSAHTALGGGLVDLKIKTSYLHTSIPVSLTFQIKLQLFPNLAGTKIKNLPTFPIMSLKARPSWSSIDRSYQTEIFNSEERT